MATIFLPTIKSFDATTNHAITFTYSGNQSIKNKLTIYENQSNDIVYDEEIVSLKLSHIIPANTLINGTNYNCEITAYDVNDNFVISNKMSFTCFSIPVWEFLGISEDHIVRNSTAKFELKYEQEQGELLNEYRITVYTAGMNILWDSGVKYDDELSTTVSGLADNTLYYIRSIGRTINGLELDTGNISFSVEYEAYSLYSLLIPENVPASAMVKISSNVVVATGIPIPEDVEFIDDEIIDLRSGGHSVVFNEGFKADEDFLIKLLGYGFVINEEIMKLGDGESAANLYWRESTFADEEGVLNTYVFIELRINQWPEYVIFSNRIKQPFGEDLISIWMRRVGGLYEVKINNMDSKNIGATEEVMV